MRARHPAAVCAAALAACASLATALVPPLAKRCPHAADCAPAPRRTRPGHATESRTRLAAVPVDIETSDKSEWYILQCYVGNEIWCGETVKEILSYPENAHSRSRVEEILVPTEKVASTRGKTVFHKDRVVYPGYMFLKWKPDQDSWNVLTRIPKVANFVGDDPGMRNGIGDVVAGYKGAVVPVPLTDREVTGMLKITLEGQDVGTENIVDTYALGDVVAVIKGALAGERGLVKRVKNDQLIVTLTGASNFDEFFEPDQVRLLTPEEVAQMAQAEEMAAARADNAAREAAERDARRKDRDAPPDYSTADAGLDSRRQRRSERKEAAPYDVDDGAGRAALRSRWDTQALASDREASLGSGAAVDADLDRDEYTTAKDDPDDALLGAPSAEDDAFFDSLFADMDEKDEKEKPGSRKAEAASDDDLLRSLLSDDGTDALFKDDDDDSFAAFLGDDKDDLFGDDDDDAELLSILGIGGGGDAAPAPAPAPAPAAAASYATMTVPKLKKLLKARGLKVGGKKAELVARLEEA